jgi:TolB protein
MNKRSIALLLGLSAALAAVPSVPARAAWPGTNGDIAYSSRPTLLGDRDIYKTPPAGGAHTPLTSGPAHDTTPFWAPPTGPSAGRIAFVRRPNLLGDPEIWVMNGNGSGAANVSNEPSIQNLNPAWSSDGSKILYNRPEGTPARQQLWIMNADGTGKHRVFSSPTGFNDTQPVWSPTSNTLAFIRDNGTHLLLGIRTTKIHTVAINPTTGMASGTPVQRSPNDTGSSTCTSGSGCTWFDDNNPDWSPDGQRIAFDRKNKDLQGRHVYRMNATGGGEVQLTSNPFFLTSNSVEPAYSPDGNEIVFANKGLTGTGPESVLKLTASGGGSMPTTVPGQGTRLNDVPNWGVGTGQEPVIPEAPLAMLLPVGAALLLVAVALIRRRRQAQPAVG